MTQVDRLLAALDRAGTRGLTRVDFQPPHVVDGGAPILNIPGRVYDLHQAGIETVVTGERDGCSVYVLASKLEALREEAAPEPSAPTGTLFDVYVDRDTSHWKAA